MKECYQAITRTLQTLFGACAWFEHGFIVAAALTVFLGVIVDMVETHDD